VGEFLAVSAFRSDHLDRVLDTVRQFFEKYGTHADRIEGDDAEGDDVLVFRSVNGWVVVAWPQYFSDVPAAEFISGALGVLASTVRIHDGDYWSHTLFRDGQVLDRFASMPDYFTDDPAEASRLAREWAGDPSIVSEAVGRPVDDVAPYLVHIVLDDDGYATAGGGKAVADDSFDREVPWVFTDFWRRLGIDYPNDLTDFTGRLRLAPGWDGRLPAGDAEL